MGKLIKGKLIAKKLEEEIAEKISELKKAGQSVKLVVVLVGDDKPSATYVNKKAQAAKRVGMEFELIKLKENTTEKEILKKLKQTQKTASGVIVQLPLPKHLNTQKIINKIKLKKDVDVLTKKGNKKLKQNKLPFLPPTPGAIISILKELKINLKNKKVTLLGRGKLVGQPLEIILKNMKVATTVCDSQTTNNIEACQAADIIISGVGKKDLVRGNMIKPGAIVIDAGVDFENGKMYGDVNIDEALKKASWVTPTPGGVGPITVARLLLNTLIAAENQK